MNHKLNKKLIADTTLRVVHLHKSNSSNKKRNGKPMVTIAKVICTITGSTLSTGTAKCSKADTPSRKIGRQLAVGRALEQLFRV